MKPTVKLNGVQSNIYSILGHCKIALIKSGQSKKAKELKTLVINSKSYDESIKHINNYVNLEK